MTDAVSTEPNQPPSRPSDEADRTQLRQAKAEGEKYIASLDYMANEVADAGGKTEAGDYLVAFAQESAEGMYRMKDGALEWVEPEKGANCHIEIAVADATDHRFIPYLDIACTLTPEGGEAIRFKPEFLWHPGLYHYGLNIEVPGDGTYDLHVAIEPPTFMRHDKTNGKRFAERVEVSFKDISIKTGRG